MSFATMAADLEAEQALIAAALTMPEMLAELSQRVRPTDFTPLNRHVWCAALELFEGGAEVHQTSVAHALHVAGKLDDVGGQTFLGDCIRNAILTRDTSIWYAEQVRRIAIARDVLSAGNAIQALVRENPDDAQRAIDRGMELLLAAAGESVEQGTRTAEQVMADGLWKRIEERMENPQAIVGLETGWRVFDQALDGLVPGRVYMYGAETSMGKSLFAHDLVRRLAMKDYPALIFTTEMAAEEVSERMIYQLAGMDPQRKRKQGFYSPDEKKDVQLAMAEFQALPITFCERGDLSFGYLRSEVRRVRSKYPTLPLVVVDHIDMVSGAGSNRAAELQGITKGIKALAMDQRVAVLEVSHLNRQTDANRNVKTARFRDSETKAADANVGWIIQPVQELNGTWEAMSSDDARSLMSLQGTIFVRLEMFKNRHGPLRQIYFEIDWNHGGKFVLLEGQS